MARVRGPGPWPVFLGNLPVLCHGRVGRIAFAFVAVCSLVSYRSAAPFCIVSWRIFILVCEVFDGVLAFVVFFLRCSMVAWRFIVPML